MANTEFNITVYFSNGRVIESQVPLNKAAKLATKQNVIIEDTSTLYEVKGLNNNIVIPINMSFVINKPLDTKSSECVSRYMVYKRDRGRCGYCGKDIPQKEATIDHILPKSRGGKTTWKNVVLACKDCNSKKDNMTPDEAGMRLLIKPYNPKKID
jgi:hypothetical protein